MRAPLSLLRLGGRLNIFDQLRLEEALYRSDTKNWCGPRFTRSQHG